MKKLMLILSLLLVNAALASDVLNYKSLDQESKVEYLWSLYLDSELDPVDFFQKQSELGEVKTLNSKIRIRIIKNSFLQDSRKSVLKIEVENLSYDEALKLASNLIHYGEVEIELSEESKAMLQIAQDYIKAINVFNTPSVTEINDLVFNGPNLNDYSAGEYLTKLFLFCRKDRSYPCRFVLVDRFEQLMRENGKIWSIPALAKSSRNLPYYITNGQTPTGVHSMDSVMPEANRQDAFGKFRRVMLDWIPKGKTIELLPSISHDQNWWKRASLARNNGRQYLRIHGTGRINDDPSLTYYPHVPTSGCISTKEGIYGKFDFKDQRKILDKLMEAQALLPTYDNESLIKGILYVVEIDDKKSAVTLNDLEKYGIK